MKKLLGSTLALAMLVPAGANAELLKNLKISGSIEVDAVSANNVSDFQTRQYDTINTVQTRLQTHADWDLLDDVHAHISLDKNNRTYGTVAETAQNVENAVTVDEAYTKIDKVFGYVDVTLGRQYYGEPGDLVIYYGPKYNLYGMPITALDAGRLDWNGEKVGVTFLASKVVGSAIATTAIPVTTDSGNVDLTGIDVHFKPTENVTGSAYIYDRTTIRSGANPGGANPPNVVGNDYLYLAGLKGKVTIGGAWLKAEFDKDFGSNRTYNGAGVSTFNGNYTGMAAKADAGYKADLGVGALTGWGQYGIGSGGSSANRSFQAIAGDYRPGGIFGRFIAAGSVPGLSASAGFGSTLTNLQVVGVGVKANPSALSKLTAGLSWYNYRFQNIAGARAIAIGSGSPASFTGSNQIGNEADLDLTWQHSENVALSIGAGSFQNNGFIKDTQTKSNNPATLAYADASIKF
jgi:hypothetical protein